MISMTQIMIAAVAALLVYFAIRVARMERSLPYVVAYPVFVIILVGGGVGVFIGMSWVSVLLGLEREAAFAVIFGATAASLFFLWWVARRAIR
jgi:hypothetical protein